MVIRYVGIRRALEAALYFKEEMKRAYDGEGLTMVCRWWDFQATPGKTILLSNIAGTALSTTRLVDWLLLMLLNPLVDFHRGPDYVLPSARPEEPGFGFASRKRETEKRESRIAAQNTLWKILQRFYRGGAADLARSNYQRARYRTFHRRYRFKTIKQSRPSIFWDSTTNNSMRHAVALEF